MDNERLQMILGLSILKIRHLECKLDEARHGGLAETPDVTLNDLGLNSLLH